MAARVTGAVRLLVASEARGDNVLHKSSRGRMRDMKAELVTLEKSGREGKRAPDTDGE